MKNRLSVSWFDLLIHPQTAQPLTIVHNIRECRNSKPTTPPRPIATVLIHTAVVPRHGGRERLRLNSDVIENTLYWVRTAGGQSQKRHMNQLFAQDYAAPKSEETDAERGTADDGLVPPPDPAAALLNVTWASVRARPELAPARRRSVWGREGRGGPGRRRAPARESLTYGCWRWLRLIQAMERGSRSI